METFGLNTKIKAGGAWQTVTPKVKVGGVWKTVEKISVKAGGAWQVVHQNTFNYTFSAGMHFESDLDLLISASQKTGNVIVTIPSDAWLIGGGSTTYADGSGTQSEKNGTAGLKTGSGYGGTLTIINNGYIYGRGGAGSGGGTCGWNNGVLPFTTTPLNQPLGYGTLQNGGNGGPGIDIECNVIIDNNGAISGGGGGGAGGGGGYNSANSSAQWWPGGGGGAGAPWGGLVPGALTPTTQNVSIWGISATPTYNTSTGAIAYFQVRYAGGTNDGGIGSVSTLAGWEGASTTAGGAGGNGGVWYGQIGGSGGAGGGLATAGGNGLTGYSTNTPGGTTGTGGTGGTGGTAGSTYNNPSSFTITQV